MIRVEVIESFKLEKFNDLKNIQRIGKDVQGCLFVGDTFECSQDMVEYLTGNNRLGKVVVKVIEVEPEKVEEPKEIIKPKKKKNKR